MADWQEIGAGIAAVLTSMGVGSGLTAWIKGRGEAAKAEHDGDATVGVALLVRDQTIADRLLTRIGDLETRCDVLSDGITESRREAEECRAGRSECERKTTELEGRLIEAEDLVERMRWQIERVETRLTSTPPGSWRVGDLGAESED